MTATAAFTVGVFQDAAWARRGVEALLRHGFPPDALSLLATESPDAAEICEDSLGGPAESIELKALGRALGRGALIDVLQAGQNALTSEGIGGTFTRAGFQRHDAYIFETLVGRGGVLVAVRDARRAADALATLHAYGGGNAAIGAWSGRI